MACLFFSAQVFDFNLTEEEMKEIGALNKNWRYIIPLITVSPTYNVCYDVITICNDLIAR